MIEVKNNFNGGLNLDDSPYLIPNNSYIDAFNVTRDATQGSNDRALTNIVGNQLVDYEFPYDNIITVSSSVDTYDGTDFVTLTFNGADFIPAGWNIKLYVGDLTSPDIIIAEYTTVSTITIYQLLINLSETISTVDLEGVSNNQLVFSYPEDDYVAPEDWAVFTAEFSTDIYKCIGSYSDAFRNTVIYFLWAQNNYHLVLEYDNETRTISPIFRNLIDSNNLDILNFTEHNKINSINIYHRNVEEGEGDILFFLDSLGRPSVMDILRFKNGEYTPVIRDIIDVAKRPPLLPPQCLYGNDSTKNANSLKDKLFRFKYRYVYDNNEKSTCSPISSVPLPIQILDKDYTNVLTNNNLITIALNSGDKDVKSVELLMSYVNKTNDWSDFVSVDVIDKTILNLKYSYIVIPSEDPEEFPASVEVTFDSTQVIGEGTVINVYFYDVATGESVLVATYTTELGDTYLDIIAGLILNCNTTSPHTGIVAGNGTNPNQITFSFTTAWSFNTIEIINNVDLLDFRYSFYNDGTYPSIDVNESIQLFDYVPDQANAQEMPNGNVLLYGGITEGYDRNLSTNVVNAVLTKKSGSSSVGQLTASWSWRKAYKTYESVPTPIFFPPPIIREYTENFISLRGIPLVGTVVQYKLYDAGTVSVKGTYTAQSGDTYVEVAQGLLASIVGWGGGDPNLVQYENSIAGEIYLRYKGYVTTPKFDIYIDSIVVTEPVTTENVFPTFLYSTQRKLGIAYFDNKGKTNGILYSGNLQFPAYDEDDDEMLLPYINTKIYHKPPEWAYSFGFYLTKENTQFLYWESTTLQQDSDFYYLKINNLKITQDKFPTKEKVISWNRQDGDRLRVIKNIDPTPSLIWDNLEAPIEGIIDIPTGGSIPEGTYVKIPKTTALVDELDDYVGDTRFLIQFFRNNQTSSNAKNEVYYEFGQQYLVGNPTLPSRFHTGSVQNQGLPPTLSNTFQSQLNTRNINFSGTVLTGTTVIINNSGVGATITQLASYTSAPGDGIDQIVDALISDLNTYLNPPDELFINVIKISTTEIEIRISASPTSPVDIVAADVQIIAPTPESVPAEFNFYDGDVYYTSRIIYLNDTTTESYNCLDRNFSDYYYSAVNSVDGRSSVIDINAKKAYYSTLVRFSNAYQANTNINGTNRFYANNFDEYDYSFGDIMRFKVRDRFMRVFQKNKVGQVPLYHQILKEQNKESLVVTDRLLNPIQYYMGDVGIGDNPESLASYNFADYFVSNKRGVICRVSNNGVDFLSVLYKVNSWTTEHLPSRIGNYKTYGVFDNRLGDYIIALEETPTDPSYTLMFDEEMNSFSTFLSYYPEMMTCLNTLLITFKDGKLWTHDSDDYNKFYGFQSASSVTMLFNQNPLDRKTFLSLSQVSSDLWVCDDIRTDLVTYGNQMSSTLIASDFENLEGSYEAAILRDLNSPGGISNGDTMKGKYMLINFNNYPANTLISLNSLSLKYINSPLNSR